MGGLFDDDPLDDDDFLDGVEDEENLELSSDFHVHTELTDTPSNNDYQNQVNKGQKTSSFSKPVLNKERIAKIKVMPTNLQKRGVATMLITRTDGRQVLFVNPNA